MPGWRESEIRGGRWLGRRYQLSHVIASGAFGTVFAARDEHLHKAVAVKVLCGHAATRPEHRARFQREAIVASGLCHDGIVRVTDIDCDPDGTSYLVMELLDGSTLAELLERGGALDVRTALGLAAQIARAAEHAHRRGVVHRDLKPANLFITAGEDGPRATILDFGLAKIAEGAVALTRRGQVLGTPCYMAPEQAQAAPVDARADVYALGIVLFEMLTGRPPFPGASRLALALGHEPDEPPPPSRRRPGLPEAIDALVLRALAADPARRYQTMGELGTAIADALAALDAPHSLPNPPARPAAIAACLTLTAVFLVLLALVLRLA